MPQARFSGLLCSALLFLQRKKKEAAAAASAFLLFREAKMCSSELCILG